MKFIKILTFVTLFTSSAFASVDYFNEGLALYKKKEFDKAKFKFEQDIVYNPKSEKSYLYLSKIFNKQKKRELEKKNLNTVILLNPRNEEAVYNLAKLKLEESDFSGSKKLVEKLISFCDNLCKNSKDLLKEIEKSLKK